MILQHLLRVVPVIGILSDKQAFKSKPNASEVETVFDAPLEMFLKVHVISIVTILNCLSIFFSHEFSNTRYLY